MSLRLSQIWSFYFLLLPSEFINPSMMFVIKSNVELYVTNYITQMDIHLNLYSHKRCWLIETVSFPNISRSSHQMCSLKKLFLEISQYLQEGTYVGFF